MYAGEGNVKLHLKVNNPTINISTWTCTMIVGLVSGGGTTTYTVTPTSDGVEATYTTVGTEFPTAGEYYVDFHALAPGAIAPNKSRVVIIVEAAY